MIGGLLVLASLVWIWCWGLVTDTPPGDVFLALGVRLYLIGFPLLLFVGGLLVARWFCLSKGWF